jgi:hypothetical protein
VLVVWRAAGWQIVVSWETGRVDMLINVLAGLGPKPLVFKSNQISYVTAIKELM